MPLKQYDQIELRPEYQGTLGHQDAIQQDRNRTPGKDEVAQYIVDNVIQDGRWPMNATDLADQVEYSRQHVSNVLQDYFKGVDNVAESGRKQADTKPFTASPDLPPEKQSTAQENVQSVMVEDNDGELHEIDVPNSVDSRTSYVRGYLDRAREN